LRKLQKLRKVFGEQPLNSWLLTVANVHEPENQRNMGAQQQHKIKISGSHNWRAFNKEAFEFSERVSEEVGNQADYRKC
jgi:hypothetical protein